MHRPSVHMLPAVAVVLATLALPFVGGGTQAGASGSVTARAAQHDGAPRGDQRFPVGSPQFELARSTAEAHWGAQACAGQVEYAWTPLDLGTNGTASWRNPTDAWNNAAENFDCRVDLNPAADYDFPKLCTVLAHELGHLLGRPHDENPGQLMSAYYTTALDSCRAAEGAPASAATPAARPAPEQAVEDTAKVRQAPRRALRKTATKKAATRKVRRCVVKKRHGKRVKRCRVVKVKARKATRTSDKATRTRGQ